MKRSGPLNGPHERRGGVDFAVAEECAAYNECTAYTEVYGDAVIDIEHADALPKFRRDVPRQGITRTDDPPRPRPRHPDDDDCVFQTCTYQHPRTIRRRQPRNPRPFAAQLRTAAAPQGQREAEAR
ncbi:endo alpha-1,4 polygalactosaminidase [Prauserella halophila]|uniref:endo alpha-1,4 polygalactosaminidase n=1 Tax=Prauserella halophila TaxID=185641 RepID=UPI003555DCF0